MERICPACNRLGLEDIKCKNCNSILNDNGRAQEIYQDDYTANMPINDGVNYCIHVFKCENCGQLENVKVDKVFI